MLELNDISPYVNASSEIGIKLTKVSDSNKQGDCPLTIPFNILLICFSVFYDFYYPPRVYEKCVSPFQELKLGQNTDLNSFFIILITSTTSAESWTISVVLETHLG